MSIFKKNDTNERTCRDYYRDYRRGQIGYRMYSLSDKKGYLTLVQTLYWETDCEEAQEDIATMERIPIEVVEDAIIEYRLKQADSGLHRQECELRLVPKGEEPKAFDMITLKQYREQIEALCRAQSGLADARQAFGWQSEVAKHAEKIVESKKKEVEETYKRLSEGRLSE